MTEPRNSNASCSSDIPHLKGWFLKEKRETFKRRGILSGNSNRRWFTIDSEENGEHVLCYFKRPSDCERSGWMFLSDVVALSQDSATNYITIEHPSRILRIQSPTPAQHRVWFSTMSKCCTNVRKDVASPSSPGRDRRPSLPYFMNASPARRNSADPVPSTPADQLKFLREITGGADADSEKENQPKKLFNDSVTPVSSPSNGSIGSKEFEIQEDKHAAAKATPRFIVKDYKKSEVVDFPGVTQATHRIHQYIKHPTQADEVCSFHDSSVESGADDGENATDAEDNFDMKSMKVALNERPEETSNGFHISTSFTKKIDGGSSANKGIYKSQSFTSVQTGYSSSYQTYFDQDDDDEILKPDENFATDDWD